MSRTKNSNGVECRRKVTITANAVKPSRVLAATPSSPLKDAQLRKLTDTIVEGDCLKVLRKLPDNSVDSIITDPPYGIQYMHMSFDKAVPSIRIFKEFKRVLKDGAFAFIMSSPRQDCLSQMINNLRQAGFNVSFSSLYWCYQTGWPKFMDTAKAVDRRLGVKPKVIATVKQNGAKYKAAAREIHNCGFNDPNRKTYNVTTQLVPGKILCWQPTRNEP